MEYRDEELNILISIYLDDLIINHDNPISLNVTIYSNGDENDLDRDKRLLCTTFIAELPSTYPNLNSLKITLCRPRGLIDEQINGLNSLRYSCLESNIGSCVLYECIESTRSELFVYELPQKAGAICLMLIKHRELIESLSPHIKQ
ncbi:unnamed protein product [Adineta steineri]|uniref:RWD domain-containing protein n=1 Tax=Adineta steineri TaxID=433720 RepID=A0A816ACA7_9BILA|nr:unnamed protein product [Adineta steineri]CAF1595896.1 unnamed protein product [Adineta steineri]